MLATFLPRIQGELLDLRTPDSGVQVVMQATALRHAAEAGGQPLQFASPQRLGAAAQLMTTLEQAVDVLPDNTLPVADGLGIAEHKPNACQWLPIPTGAEIGRAH